MMDQAGVKCGSRRAGTAGRSTREEPPPRRRGSSGKYGGQTPRTGTAGTEQDSKMAGDTGRLKSGENGHIRQETPDWSNRGGVRRQERGPQVWNIQGTADRRNGLEHPRQSKAA